MKKCYTKRKQYKIYLQRRKEMIWFEMSYNKYSKLLCDCQDFNYKDYIDYDTDNEYYEEDIADEFNETSTFVQCMHGCFL